MTKNNRKAKVKARKSSEKSKISPLSGPEVKSPIVTTRDHEVYTESFQCDRRDCGVRGYFLYFFSSFKQKYKRQFEFISVCVCVSEGAQTCLFEPYDSELTELEY